MTTATETQPTISASPWQWANDTPVWLRPRRTVYFLVRHVGDNHDDWSTGKVEYRQNKRGHVITYGTREQAIRIQNRLNAKRTTSMTTATQTESTITLSNFRVVYRAPRYEDGRVLYDGYCAILADDAALDGAEVRVFDVPDVDEGQLATALFACDAMNQHERMRTALKAVIDFYAYHRQGSVGAMASGPLSGEVLSLVREALATTTTK